MVALNVPLPKPRRDSNPQPPLREGGALSIELLVLAQPIATRRALLKRVAGVCLGLFSRVGSVSPVAGYVFNLFGRASGAAQPPVLETHIDQHRH